MVIPSGKYAVGHFEIFQDEYKGAWDFLYGEWRQIADINRETRILLKYIEIIQSKDPKHKHIVDIYVPIEPFNHRLKGKE